MTISFKSAVLAIMPTATPHQVRKYSQLARVAGIAGHEPVKGRLVINDMEALKTLVTGSKA